jgi:hypothetical protein
VRTEDDKKKARHRRIIFPAEPAANPALCLVRECSAASFKKES